MRRLRGLGRQYDYSILRPLSSLKFAITRSNPQFIIPCDDVVTEHLTGLSQNLRSEDKNLSILLENVLGSSDVREILKSRYKLIALARDEGVLAPETEVVEAKSDLERWASTKGLNAYLKRDGSFGGDGTRQVSSQHQAKKTLAALAKGPALMEILKELISEQVLAKYRIRFGPCRPVVNIQKAIVGAPANCSFMARDGEVLAVVAVKVLRTARPNGLGTHVVVIENDEMSLAASKLARRLKLTGIFGLDFVIEHSTGRPWLIEMNPRPTPISHFRLGGTQDLVGAALSATEGPAASTLRSPCVETPIALFPHHLRSAGMMCETGVLRDFPAGQPDLVAACTPVRRRVANAISWLFPNPHS